MIARRIAFQILLASSFGAVVAAACSSSNEHQAQRDDAAGAAGESNGGGPSSAGGSTAGSADTGMGGSDESGGASLAGAATNAGGNDGGGVANGGGDSGGETGAGGASVDFGEPTDVDSFGCFIHSGDGGDLLPSGEIAVNVTNPVYSAACDSAWVSSNANAFAPQDVPTTITMRRSFIVDPNLGAGDFSITYKADDAIDFFLNGQLIIGCTPPQDNAGLCQQVCNTSAIPADALNPPGTPNLLEARLINTQSIPAGGGNFGYAALNYSVCVVEIQ